MKRSLTCLIFLLLLTGSLFSQQAPVPAAIPLMKQMHGRYFRGPCRSYTFSQRNAHYRNDSVIKRSVWHEAVDFPDKFKIIFGDTVEGNFVVFKNDSAFNHKKGKLLQSRRDSNMVLLLIGGMYYRSFKDMVERFGKAGIDINLMHTVKGEDGEVYVLGAKKGDMHKNQVWVDATALRVIRIIQNSGKSQMDMRFEKFQKSCRGFVETKVSFYRNGKLEQVEEYYNIKESAGFKE